VYELIAIATTIRIIVITIMTEKGVVAGTSGLSGIGCDHCITSEYHF